MTDIKFYVSKEEGLEQRLAIAYRLILRAQQQNLKIHVHTDSEATSVKFDDFLWCVDSQSFIAHGIIDSSTDSDKPSNIEQIHISHDFEPLIDCDYLINLSNQRPTFFSRFSKMAEILDNNEEILTAGRKRYSFYRDRGYTLGYYQL